MVDIYVGAERKKFRLHRDVLCGRSDYFKACFEGNFNEAQQKELSLPEDDIKSFALFVGWMYGGFLKRVNSKDEIPAYFRLVVFANKLCLEYLQNEAMDCILRFHRTNPVGIDYQTLHYLYENTSNQDCIRLYSLAIVAWAAVSEHWVGLPESYHHLVREGGDLAVDFAHSLLVLEDVTKGDDEIIRKYDPRRLSNCTYHKHTSTPKCGDTSGKGSF